MSNYFMNLVVGLALLAFALVVGSVVLGVGYWLSGLVLGTPIWPLGAVLRVILFLAVLYFGFAWLTMLWGVLTNKAEPHGAALRAQREFERGIAARAALTPDAAEIYRGVERDVSRIMGESLRQDEPLTFADIPPRLKELVRSVEPVRAGTAKDIKVRARTMDALLDYSLSSREPILQALYARVVNCAAFTEVSEEGRAVDRDASELRNRFEHTTLTAARRSVEELIEASQQLGSSDPRLAELLRVADLTVRSSALHLSDVWYLVWDSEDSVTEDEALTVLGHTLEIVGLGALGTRPDGSIAHSLAAARVQKASGEHTAWLERARVDVQQAS
jgi:hypothetical protein